MNKPTKISPNSALNTSLPTLNIIGSGKLGRTLARLFSDAGLVTMGAIYNRNIESSQAAQAFIGSGRVTTNIEQLSSEPAELWMISTPDDTIKPCAEQLANLIGIDWKKATALHCSGLKTSAELIALQKQGCATASAHPAHSFASPEHSLSSFPSTVCTLEGNERATNILDALFSAIGGQVTTIEPEAKPLYHAATVMASNYLITLLGTSETLLKKAGIEDALANAVLAALMRQSLENGLQVGPVNALTGPIARGDSNTLQAHIKAIKQSVPELDSVYSSMGIQALKLARQQGYLDSEELAAIEKILHD
ncbi:MAG: hypothetical protein COA75_13235 [Cellvibrionales bacterium]|nr:MAG: hypothetical protein COA75_13390 [Cellvibrionales bacterium]PCJ34563.1 MAG: hypothetical protein COA75_13235 [Cellvibrionales bacterium]